MKQATLKSFFKRPRPNESDETSTQIPSPNESIPLVSNVIPQRPCSNEGVGLEDLPKDPADRPNITTYNSNQRDEVRRAYLLQGPCQIKVHDFPSKRIGSKDRHFIPQWYDEFNWLEYSKKKDKAYCLYCYVCGDLMGQKGGKDAFVTQGFNTWNRAKDAFRTHVGNIDSFHNKAREKCEFLMRPKQGIDVVLRRQTGLEDNKYKARLRVSVTACRHLLKNALPFRGHDESSGSNNRGLFIETIEVIRVNNEEHFNNTLENAPKNNQVTCPKSQKEIAQCFSQEILLSIKKEIGQDVFALLVDESSDVSRMEQMAIVLRYVDTLGNVKERFVGLKHVMDTSAITLKNAIDDVLTSLGLTFSQVRGQGYDGASNMRGAFNGLKALILQENESSYYVHCFAHQLQLVIVAVAKKHVGVHDLFDNISLVVNVVCASCKRKDMLREKKKESLQKAIECGELEIGRGLNQESTLSRAGDTRWGSHFNTIISLMKLFSEVLEVLAYVEDEGTTYQNRKQAEGILSYFTSYEFVFYLLLMYEVFSHTSVLSKQLQRKNLDILEAASMVRGTMDSLKVLRDTGFDSILLPKVSSLCLKHKIDIVDMTQFYVGPRNRTTTKTNRFHFEVEIFNTIVDMQVVEFGERFSETSTQLLEYMGALSPCNSFAKFDKLKLLKLSEFYKNDFDDSQKIDLAAQLETYHRSCLQDDHFTSLEGIADLSRLMVETGKHQSYPLVYKLLKLTLVLPVATATVERCFSNMKLVKTDLRNKIGNDFMNDALICNVESDTLMEVKLEDVMDRFTKMSIRRSHI